MGLCCGPEREDIKQSITEMCIPAGQRMEQNGARYAKVAEQPDLAVSITFPSSLDFFFPPKISEIIRMPDV